MIQNSTIESGWNVHGSNRNLAVLFIVVQIIWFSSCSLYRTPAYISNNNWTARQCLLSRTSKFVPVNDGMVQQSPGRKPGGLDFKRHLCYTVSHQDNVKSGISDGTS